MYAPGHPGELTQVVDFARAGCPNAPVLLLAGTGFDAVEFLCEVAGTGAQFPVRSSARRCPALQRRLPDGSHLAGSGYDTLPVHVIEARIALTPTDGSTRREP